jgi:hypothetical protein
LAVKKASVAIEQARPKRAVLVGYTKVKTLKQLNDSIVMALEHELAKKSACDRLKATRVGFFRKLIRND